MTTINDAYINALLADSSYVNDLVPGMTGAALRGQLAGRMTLELATYIGDNFMVVTQAGGLASSFEATVWRGNAGTPYAGQVYVSMRGTQEGPDFTTDADLAATGLAHRQLADMVNWWLRETTPVGQSADQVVVDSTVIPGLPLPIQNFVAAPQVQGTGGLAGIGAVTSVNGHSLGGYLASSFVRLFGSQWPVERINTFNSAGFSRPAEINIESGFNQIAQLIGPSLGLPTFFTAQNNYYALNGINVTTNTWNPIGFRQYGTRIGMFQEDLTPGIINNHYMYKLTDMLALANALERLDSSFGLTKMSALVSSSSAQMDASYERALDGLRRVVLGLDVPPTPIGDNNGTNAGPQPDARLKYHANLAEVQNSDFFQSLVGQMHIEARHDATAAHDDFAALLSLTTGATFSLHLNDPSPASSASLALYANHRMAYEQWLADRNLTPEQRDAGQANFSDAYLADRVDMLNTLAQANTNDDNFVNLIGGGYSVFYADLVSTTAVVGQAGTGTRFVTFGGTAADVIDGAGRDDHLYGGGGNDTLSGQGGADWLEGNAGDDQLDGGANNDTLLGGQGNDVYAFNGSFGRDVVIDADGSGSISWNGGALPQGLKVFDGLWQSADRQVTYTLVKNEPGADGIERHDLVISFADNSSNRIVIRGWNEDARSLGISFGGNFPLPATTHNYIGDFTKKIVRDSEGNLTNSYEKLGDNYVADVEAGPQNGAADQIVGLFDADAIYGLGGDDALFGREGDDFIDGGDGSDVLQGGLGRDRIIGGAGRDVIYGSSQGSVVSPTQVDFQRPTQTQPILFATGFNWVRDGNITQEGFDDGFLSNTVQRDDGIGDAGNYIDAGADNDFVAAGQGDDIVLLGDGKDVAYGMAGADVLAGGRDNDLIYGDGPVGPGADSLVIDAAGTQHGADVISGDEGDDILIGQGGDDILFGGADNDKLWGDDRVTASTPVEFHGNDLLFGGTGNDTLVGGAKDDELNGETGNDVLWGDSGGVLPGSEGFFDQAYHGNDTLNGGAGDDLLYGEGGADRLFGGDGNDQLLGDDVESVLPAQRHGNDYLDGGAGNDLIQAGGGADTLIGGAGNDDLFGEGGTDTLLGGDGSDFLSGGADNDYLDGGADLDNLFGGEGNDTLVGDNLDYFDGGAGDDLITVRTVANSQNVAFINDGEGINTIVIDGVDMTRSSPQLFNLGGSVYLSAGNGHMVGIGNQVSLAATQLDTGNGSITLQRVVLDEDSDGYIHSRVLTTDGQLFSTGSVVVAQALQGSGFADALDGGSASDTLQGAGGDDALDGGAGNDLLYGGAGADVLVGGTGNDTLAGGSASGPGDDGIDTYVFQLGDGVDRIDAPSTPGDGIARDVIQFGEGVTAQSLHFMRGQTNLASGYADLIIAYSTLDSITLSPGAFSEIAQIRFADGSHLNRNDILQILTGDAAANQGSSTLSGGFGDNTLIGGGQADWLFGEQGNDLLIGGAGSDHLAGGSGKNTYVFGADSGLDVITPDYPSMRWPNYGYGPAEQGVLRFDDAQLAQLEVTRNGNDVLVAQSSGSVVRVSDFEFLPALAQWLVVDRDGQQATLGELLAPQTPATGTLAERRAQFLDTQRVELGTLSHRTLHQDYRNHPVVTSQVTQVVAQIAVDGDFVHENYLSPIDRVASQTTYVNQPVYQTSTIILPAQPARFVLLADILSGSQLPSGAEPVYAGTGTGYETSLIGYRFPAVAATTQSVSTVVGWQTVAQTRSNTRGDDIATQTTIMGTAGADRVVPAPSTTGLPTLFRGAVDTGDGNDVVLFGSGTNGANARVWSRYEDWMPSSTFWQTGGAMYERGAGAWIDLGAGDDQATGTDGDDFIIAGAGSDQMDGQAGSDTYFIAQTSGDVDVVSDLAFLPSRRRREDVSSDGSEFGAQSVDTVEFDAGIALGELTYRWVQTPLDAFHPIPDADETATLQSTLELFRNGQRFLDVDYLDIGGTGIEQFRFANGETLNVYPLLDQLTIQSLGSPVANPPQGAAQASTGAAFTLDAAANFSEANGDRLTYSAALADGSSLPGFLAIDSRTGALTGVAALSDIGQFTINVTATNTAGLSASMAFDVAVARGNTAPVVVEPLPEIVELHQGDSFTWQVPAGTFDDADFGDKLSLSVSLADGSALPQWLRFDPTSGLLSGRPVVGDTSTYAISIKATDGAGASAASVVHLQLVAYAADEVYTGSAVADFHTSGEGNDWLSGLGGDDTLSGADGQDLLNGGAGNDQLNGDSGDDVLVGGTGADTMRGGSGDDIYGVDSASDVVIENADEGIDLVRSTVSYALSDNVENLTLFGTDHLIGTGNGLDNTLIGNDGNNALSGGAGNDTINGGAGVDTLRGGVGDDVYTVDNAGDVVIESAGEGIDRVRSSINYTLGVNVENLTLIGTGSVSGIGNALNNTLVGNEANNVLSGDAGDDLLNGGAGADTMKGGSGNDTYLVDSAADVVIENIDEGIDVVRTTVSYTLSDNVENLTLIGTDSINGSGNALDNTIIGNDASNLLSGGSGNDLLNGGAGTDTMQGGTGDDIYVVDSAADLVSENAGEGIDLVRSTASYVLGDNVENLTLFGTDALSGSGNALDNTIIGNGGSNVLSGSAGNDTLNGGAGADTMRGGIGDDIYTVDDTGDMVIELAGEGIDLVRSSINYALGANIENLTLIGTDSLSGTGNALDNILIGNAANNLLSSGAGNDTINGGAGDDTMQGGAGNDLYIVNSTADVVSEKLAEGIDAVESSVTWTLAANVENLTLTGAGNRNGTGNALDNLLMGNSGNNTLAGQEGSDTYQGGAGNDTLVDSSTTSNDVYRWGVGQGNDSITDAGGADRIEIAAGVAAAQVSLVRNGNNLQVKINGAADVLTVMNWYVATANRIETIALADGTIINAGTAAPLSVAAPTGLAREVMQIRDTRHLGVPGMARPGVAAGDVASARNAQLMVQAMSSFDSRADASDLTHWHRVRDPMHVTLAIPT
jgi:Ca2+-binding RTX toxin-like protein